MICILAAVLSGAALATSNLPSATTFDVTKTGLTTATVDGSVNPNGQATTYKVEYDLASADWCTTDGSSGSPSSTTAQTLGSTEATVSVDLTGLTGGTDYCAELVATNGSGSGYGGQVSFTAGAPSVQTSGTATATGATTATVAGVVDPTGQTTTYRVEYAQLDAEWCTTDGSSGSPSSTTPQTLGFTDETFHDVSVDLTGLTGGTDYCALLVATNGSGSGDSGRFTFTAGAPSASTFDVTVTGATTATVDGSVNPAGQTTTYEVEYDLASSPWCSANLGSPAHSTTPQTLSFTDATSHDVSVDLTGLTGGTDYCADLVASNGSGSADGSQVPFTAGLPSATTYVATPTGLTTATVEGVVNPSGQTTTYKVEYGPASSTWCTSGGSSGSPASSTTTQTLSSTDATSHYLSIDLTTGLTAGTAYCADLVATNGTGSADGGQVSFTAGLPSATSRGGGPGPTTGPTTATIEGSVNPAGQTTTYKVEYGLASSDWCTSGGSSGLPASSTAPQTLGFTDGTFHDVSVDLTGLTAGTGYCADLVATNGTGSADGYWVSFTAGAPGVAPYSATPTGATTATVDGSVNPAGQTTTYKVEYGPASSDWCTSGGSSGSPASSTSPQPLGFTDGTFHDVSVDLTGLTAGTGYCGDLVATNGSGSAVSGQVSFTAGAPSAFTNSPVTVTGATTATVDGSVNPAGQTTTYKVEYDLASSDWCASGGSSGSPASSTTPQTLGFSDATDHDVTVALTGLTAGTHYCADLVATNGSGSGDGGQVSFTTTAAAVTHSLTVSLSGAGSGTVSGTGISCPGTCSHSYPTGTVVTLTAAPAAGSFFAGWSGGGCSGTSSCQVTVNGDTTVTATFAITVTTTHNLTVSKSGAGTGTVTSSPVGIDCGSTCVHAFNSGTSVTLTAVPAAGSRFGGWSGGSCSGSGSCALTLNADTTVTATFTKVPSVVVSVQTRISKATINSKKRTATFKFAGSGGSKPYSFQCKLDKKKWASCKSGMTYTTVKPGKHTFWVRAKDHAGRLDKTPANKKFKIKS